MVPAGMDDIMSNVFFMVNDALGLQYKARSHHIMVLTCADQPWWLQMSWPQTDPKLSRTMQIRLRLQWHAQHISHYSYVDERFSARPTNDISIKFEIRPKFEVPWFQMYSTDHNEILHMSQQCNCHDVYKISLWSVELILN